MAYYSHAKKDNEGQKYGSKLLSQHTQGVSDHALSQLHSNLSFSFLEEEGKKFIQDLCQFHDLGKYTPFFQKYLMGQPTDASKKQHARFGAFALYNLYQKDNLNPKLAYLAYYLILYHHRNLAYPLDSQADRFLDKYDLDLQEIFEEQVSSLLTELSLIEKETSQEDLRLILEFPDSKPLKKYLKKWLYIKEASVSIEDYFFINYFFSLLIEADKLDASDTPLHIQQPLSTTAVDDFIQSLGIEPTPQNMLRNEVRKEVIQKLSDPTILTQRIFLLTAPTGIGKTLTALDFALQLRTRISDAENYTPQIITGLPFINIIEQTLAVYQKVLPKEQANILGHYQYADIFGESEKSDHRGYDQKLMQLDTWQSDIVVTSFVQLLQTLISNKNKLLKKFNHFAGAIIIMDEVQSLRLEQVPLIGAMLFYLSEFLHTRLILMTATQPLIFDLADTYILQKYGVSTSGKVTQLLEHPQKYFQAFHRTQLIPLVNQPLKDEGEFIEIFTNNWESSKSCLIVVNTVNRSLTVFQALQEYFEGNGFENSLYYLSTNVIPAHRLERIQSIKDDLKAGKCPILVSTQVVEAGVDLDFDMGFRDIGPIDSIVQVAGRINRENSESRKYSPLYVVDFGDCQNIYGLITEKQAKQALTKDEILEPEYFDLVETYFKRLTQDSVYLYSEEMFDAISQLKYDGEADHVVSKFRVIEESNKTVSVFIGLSENAIQAKKAFIEKLTTNGEEKKLAKRKFDEEYKRTFHQHIITVPNYYLPPSLEKIVPELIDLEVYVVESDKVEDYYQLQTGFIRENQDYSEASKKPTIIL